MKRCGMKAGVFKSCVKQLILNYFVAYIPCWFIRKTAYKIAGLRIGEGSRILMGCKIEGPRGIRIGNNTHVNSGCHLDGRGGLYIGDNVNISNYSAIISASHDMKSESFSYRLGAVTIKDCCWLGTRSIVLDNSTLEERVVIGAGSCFKGESIAGGVYVGVPAKWVKDRGLLHCYEDVWKIYLI